MLKLSRKLYISLFTLILLVVVTGTVTFAWFKLNTDAWFDDMQLDVAGYGGIKISVNGIDYMNNLDTATIKKAVYAKSQGYTLAGGLEYYIDEDGNYISAENYEEDFDRISLQPVTSADGHNFKTLYGVTRTHATMDLIGLDIYFKADVNERQIIYFNNIDKYSDDMYIPKTSITVNNADYITFPTGLSGTFSTYDQTTGDKITYDVSDGEAVENFVMRASDAVRFSTQLEERNASGQVTNTGNYKIYEINKGQGSYATDLTEDFYSGVSGSAYDSTKNAGFTYFNSVRAYETGDEITAIPFEGVPDTYKGLDTVEAATICTLDESNGYGEAGSVKLSINLWVEGWDADCMDSVFEQIIQVKFSFTRYNVTEDPVELTYETTNPETGNVVDSRVVNQIIGDTISDNSPVKDIYSSGPKHKFLGWSLKDPSTGEATKDENGNIILYDFSKVVRPANENDLKWTLISVWQ